MNSTERRFGRDRERPERCSLWAHRCQLAGRTPVGMWTFASGGSQDPSGSSREDRHRWSGPGQGGRAMKRVVVERFGGPEVLKVVEDEDPRPGPGEVRVTVLAAGVSFTDSQLRAGTYIPGGPKPPFTPGYELVGVVEELGPGLFAIASGRPHRRADRVGGRRGAGLRARGERGRRPRGPRPCRGAEPRVHLHDRLP